MDKFGKRNLKNIQNIFENKTGVSVSACKSNFAPVKAMAIASLILCFVSISAFTYNSLSDINGDELGFDYNYIGNGVVEVIISNMSDKVLNLQPDVKLESWKGGTVSGNPELIELSKTKVEAHSTEKIEVDFSKGYDVAELEKELPDGDWYYLVLTNNNFAFGQDWMCSIGFSEKEEYEAPMITATEIESESVIAETKQTSELRYDTWVWPTESKTISGDYPDHINIAGNSGDDIYSVADGVVLETGYKTPCGNYITVDLGNQVIVKYGHLKEIQVKAGDNVASGDKIATLGQTGMATGPNLYFAVFVDGEAVSPFSE